MTTNRKQLHERLWAAAEQLRANGELKLNEITILFSTLEIQRQIVEKPDKQMQSFGSVRFLKSQAEKRIVEIMAKEWGV